MKKFLISVFGLVIATIMITNVSIAKNNNNKVTLLISLVKNAIAECEAGSVQQCPGGSCTYTDQLGQCCSACCPSGKDPECDSYGCRCE